jgi:translation initiation factor IF-3
MTRQSLGRQILERLITDLGDKAVVEFRPRQEGNTLHAILAPAKAKPEAKPKPPHPPQAQQPPPQQAPPA